MKRIISANRIMQSNITNNIYAIEKRLFQI